MLPENSYSSYFTRLPDEELSMYVENPADYEADAVIAAILELKKRGNLTDNASALLKSIEENRINAVPAEPVPVPAPTLDPSATEDEKMPVLYSKRAIRFFSILFSTFFGGILLAINLSRLNKKSEIVYVLTFSVLFSYAAGVLATRFIEYSSIIAVIMNLLGLFVLELLFWKRIIGDDLKYKPKSVWLPAGIGLALAGILAWMMMK